MEPSTSQLLPYLIPLAIILIIVRRNLRARPLRVERLWVLPVVLFAITAFSLASRPPTSPIALIAAPIVLGLGCLAGWWRGRFTSITIDPETHALTSKASALGLVLIAALFVIRYGLRLSLEQSAATHGPRDADAASLADGFLLFAVGMIGAQRLEMWLRARRLLAQSIADKATRAPVAS